ncbi:MAG: chromate transporter [Alphaproteobacteria bacterium]|nr:chromate transporter [Alphaproteobacteria bacterium]
MTHLLLFIEFFKIGLFAIGGGLVTIPFLFNLTEKYDWFSRLELTNMIAIAESTPGPIGVNMATYAGFNTEGIIGALIATFALVLPSFIIIVIISRLMDKYSCNIRVKDFLSGVRPAVIALILWAGVPLAQISLTSELNILIFAAILAAMRLWKKSPIFYIAIAAFIGILLKL